MELTSTTLCANLADDNFFLSPLETVYMKCQILFSGKIRKNISVCRQLNILLSLLNVRVFGYLGKNDRYYFASYSAKRAISSKKVPSNIRKNLNAQIQIILRMRIELSGHWLPFLFCSIQ